MLNTQDPVADFKNEAYDAFSQVTKALGSPRRLELLDVLVQGPRSVDALAAASRMSVPSTSQHLQVLRRARLVETTREGNRVIYALGSGVGPVFVALRRLAHQTSPDLAQAAARFHPDDAIARDDLIHLMARDRATLVDVRPRAEFAQGHIEGARNIPIGELEGRVNELPRDRVVVATCRGPFCVFAQDAVQLLTRAGFVAQRFEDGVAEWAADGGEVV